ncbi:hypothetical protein HK405_002735, partial [Cladochytrium tenue]
MEEEDRSAETERVGREDGDESEDEDPVSAARARNALRAGLGRPATRAILEETGVLDKLLRSARQVLDAANKFGVRPHRLVPVFERLLRFFGGDVENEPAGFKIQLHSTIIPVLTAI